MSRIQRNRLPLSNPPLVLRRLSDLKADPKNAREHSPKQIHQISRACLRFGYFNPILIDDRNRIIAGHGRLEAAKLLNYEEVPCFVLSGLTEQEKIALALADNKIPSNAKWNKDLLREQLIVLAEPSSQIDYTLAGFDTVEIDLITQPAIEIESANDDEVPPLSTNAVTRLGDIWQLDQHRVICGDSRQPEVFEALLREERARMAFQDPPYNVKIDGHVSGLGQVRHREFAMASGEMSTEEFRRFLAETLPTAYCQDGAIVYSCMDWRHMSDMLEAGLAAGLTHKNLCVWAKTNAGMGTFYRSAHELVFVFKKGTVAHVNNFGLGNTGRYRTNVWDYPGANAFGSQRRRELSAHPTPKPVAMIADAIRDVSHIGEIVLDSFGGSGSTLIAAERTGRKARLVEIDPLYVDTTIRRWQRIARKDAVLEQSGRTFAQISQERE